jgi:hypothetical protein
MADWTDILDSQIDADSPLDEDFWNALDGNMRYNYERAIRSGPDVLTKAQSIALGAGRPTARTCMARGKTMFSWSGAASGTQVVVFSNAEDGDPNFLAAPSVSMGLQESSPGDDWASDGPVEVYIEDGTLDETGFTARIDFGGSLDPIGWVHWIAIGPVSADE